MTKMDNACDNFASTVKLDLVGMDTLDALNAGNRALELLWNTRIEEVSGGDLDGMLKLLKEWKW
jgi:hypothetical protein